MWTLAVRSGRQHGGTAAGIFNTGGNLGGIVSPVLTPYIGERFGWNTCFWVVGAVCVLGATLWIWIDGNVESGGVGEQE